MSTWQINLVFVCDGVSTWQIRDLFVMCSRHAHATTEYGKFIVALDQWECEIILQWIIINNYWMRPSIIWRIMLLRLWIKKKFAVIAKPRALYFFIPCENRVQLLKIVLYCLFVFVNVVLPRCNFSIWHNNRVSESLWFSWSWLYGAN